jgi:hypothetical protein
VGKSVFVLAFATSGFSSIFGGVNLLVTIIRMRAKGMTFFRIPDLRPFHCRHRGGHHHCHIGCSKLFIYGGL